MVVGSVKEKKDVDVAKDAIKKSSKSPITIDKGIKKSTGELKIFKTRKEVKSPTSSSKDDVKEEERHRSRHKSPTKLLKRLLSPQRTEPKTQVKKSTTEATQDTSITSTKPKKSTRDKSPLNGRRDIQPEPSIELDPDEGKLKISTTNNSEQKISQTVLMHRKVEHGSYQVYVVSSRKMSVDNLNGGPKRRNEFFYPQRSSICATFTLDRSKKLAGIVGPKSPGLLSQHQNSAFTSNTSLNTSLNNPLNSRSMSSHQLLNQLNQQQIKNALSTSASSTTIHSLCLNPDQTEVLTPTNSTPTQSSSPLTNTLPKFPASQPNLIVEESETDIITQIEQNSKNAQNSQEAMVESVNAKTATLADKLSRSFFDLTQGSQDRLAKWKSKLQNYGSQQRQRSTEKEITTSRRMASLDGSVPGNDVMVVDWRTEPTAKPRRNPPIPPPRPLHSSRSATNALTHGLSLESSLPMSRTKHIGTSTATLPHTLHKSASVRDADTLVNEHRLASHHNSPQINTMEHRTLKQRENLITGRRSPPSDLTRAQHMRSLHELVQSIEGFQQNSSNNEKPRNTNLHNTRNVLSQDCSSLDVELPPPAKLMPYSGIKPQDNGIIRPIAFRPLANSAGLKHANRHSNSPDAMPSFYSRSNITSIEQHKQALKDHSRSIGNLNTLSTPRSRNPLQQPSTSSSSQLFGGKSIGSLPTADENAYDVVPEYLNEPSNNEGNYSSIYPFHSQSSQQNQGNQSNQQHRNHSQNAPKRQPNSNFFSAAHSNGTNSSQFTNSSNSSTTSPPHNGLKKSVSGSQQNVQGHAVGAHITPSPSDSGIILDYESLIREKETELTSVRHAMEQNEEVLIRVYQEKERQYKQQVDDLKQKLHNVQQGEAAIRKEAVKMQKSVQNLNDEKIEMQRKYAQIERELNQLRSRLDEQPPCDTCRRAGNQTQSIYENNGLNGLSNGSKPVPAPRLMNKEGDLRSEVDDLKSEVSMLREQLNRQVEFFEDERKRWQQNPHLSPHSDTTHMNNNNIQNKPTHFSAFGQQRSLSEKRPLLNSNTDRLI